MFSTNNYKSIIIPLFFIIACFFFLYLTVGKGETVVDKIPADKTSLMKSNLVKNKQLKANIKKLRNRNKTGLPLTWCGKNTYTDLPGTPEELHFKVLYALPKNSKNRLKQLASHIQADIVAINLLWAKETRGQKAIRWDMGTSCGTQYVDIMTVNLPYTASQYISNEADNPADDIETAVVPMLGEKDSPATCNQPSNTHALVYIDGSAESGEFSGIGYGSEDNKPVNNENDCGGGIAIVDIGRNDIPTTPWLLPNTAGHEILHSLGTSQSSPNSTEHGHCTDEHDLLCYDDGSRKRMKLICKNNKGIGPIAEGLDCGRNDYFAIPGEEKSSWLKNNWNIYNSKALISCQEAVKACQGELSKKSFAGDTASYSLSP